MDHSARAAALGLSTSPEPTKSKLNSVWSTPQRSGQAISADYIKSKSTYPLQTMRGGTPSPPPPQQQQNPGTPVALYNTVGSLPTKSPAVALTDEASSAFASGSEKRARFVKGGSTTGPGYARRTGQLSPIAGRSTNPTESGGPMSPGHMDSPSVQSPHTPDRPSWLRASGFDTLTHSLDSVLSRLGDGPLDQRLNQIGQWVERFHWDRHPHLLYEMLSSALQTTLDETASLTVPNVPVVTSGCAIVHQCLLLLNAMYPEYRTLTMPAFSLICRAIFLRDNFDALPSQHPSLLLHSNTSPLDELRSTLVFHTGKCYFQCVRELTKRLGQTEASYEKHQLEREKLRQCMEAIMQHWSKKVLGNMFRAWRAVKPRRAQLEKLNHRQSELEVALQKTAQRQTMVDDVLDKVKAEKNREIAGLMQQLNEQSRVNEKQEARIKLLEEEVAQKDLQLHTTQRRNAQLEAQLLAMKRDTDLRYSTLAKAANLIVHASTQQVQRRLLDQAWTDQFVGKLCVEDTPVATPQVSMAIDGVAARTPQELPMLPAAAGGYLGEEGVEKSANHLGLTPVTNNLALTPDVAPLPTATGEAVGSPGTLHGGSSSTLDARVVSPLTKAAVPPSAAVDDAAQLVERPNIAARKLATISPDGEVGALLQFVNAFASQSPWYGRLACTPINALKGGSINILLCYACMLNTMAPDTIGDKAMDEIAHAPNQGLQAKYLVRMLGAIGCEEQISDAELLRENARVEHQLLVVTLWQRFLCPQPPDSLPEILPDSQGQRGSYVYKATKYADFKSDGTTPFLVDADGNACAERGGDAVPMRTGLFGEEIDDNVRGELEMLEKPMAMPWPKVPAEDSVQWYDGEHPLPDIVRDYLYTRPIKLIEFCHEQQERAAQREADVAQVSTALLAAFASSLEFQRTHSTGLSDIQRADLPNFLEVHASTIARTCSMQHEDAQQTIPLLLAIIRRHYPRLRAIYRFYSSSNAATNCEMSFDESWRFTVDSGVTRKGVLEPTHAREIFKASKLKVHPDETWFSVTLSPAEWLVYCLQVAHKTMRLYTKLAKKFEMLLEDYVLPMASYSDYTELQGSLSNNAAMRLLARYRDEFKKAYTHFTKMHAPKAIEHKGLMSRKAFDAFLLAIAMTDDKGRDAEVLDRIWSRAMETYDAPSLVLSFPGYELALCALAAFKHPQPYVPIHLKIQAFWLKYAYPTLKRPCKLDDIKATMQTY